MNTKLVIRLFGLFAICGFIFLASILIKEAYYKPSYEIKAKKANISAIPVNETDFYLNEKDIGWYVYVTKDEKEIGHMYCEDSDLIKTRQYLYNHFIKPDTLLFSTQK